MNIEELTRERDEARAEAEAPEPTYHWLCIVCCDYAEDPDGMPAGWQWIPPGIPMCGECLANIEQREKGAKP